jgi:hypothetical protein
MAAKDIVHDIVREALEKEGWFIIRDPFFLRVSENISMFVDLAADKLLLAERETLKIAVEVKSFVGLSNLSDFHLAVGQFLNYRLALEELESDRILYLAIPDDIYNTFFQDSFIQKPTRCSNCQTFFSYLMSCSGSCKGSEKYCSYICQKDHWNETHKYDCKRYE